ncbi:hypothetical protein Sme01_57340 [Sphaerisporangium melleum]|uniref:PIN domain-containing protein n=1 Tax=Sphaerisporangium melleum TaxID=321316 RepID=A0A917R8I4_9ACTN|nr:hypothetical protein GCM10007964_41220 [Sphaerisporangium melleum]GII73258.1 hypothetical protein Sme01_57340 [Sphaerisporangium melleum]
MEHCRCLVAALHHHLPRKPLTGVRAGRGPLSISPRTAVNAMLSATALAAPGPVTVLTSDPKDLAALCGVRITVIKI